VGGEALALALGAAGLHAGWNLALAGRRDVPAATAIAFCFAALLFLPVAAFRWDVDAAAVPYMAVSAGLELAYVALLAAAYGRAELSVVYPVARGLAPVLVLLIGVAALGVGTSSSEVLAVLLVATGVLLVRGIGRQDAARGVGFGLAIGACIAGYTLADARGVEHADPIAYLIVVLALPSIAYLVAVGMRGGRERLAAELSWTTLLVGLASFGAFALALFALRLASAASVSAVRETSVVIAVALAAPVLGERVGPRRLAGAVLVVAGVAVLAAL
jgi:drug/metabolite transporter (DMT)-like permease